MLKAIILLCASTLDHSACTPATASSVMTGGTCSTPAQCLIASSDLLAAHRIGPQEYVKFWCERR